MLNTIYLRRRRRVLLPPGTAVAPLVPVYPATLLKNLESLGFTLSAELLARVETLTLEELREFYEALLADLRAMLGATQALQPMYPDFPAQVMAAPVAELYLNAVVHYLTGLLPHYPATERAPLTGQVQLQRIGLGTEAEFTGLFTNLMRANTSLSTQDQADLAWFVAHYRATIADYLPATVPQKENAALLGSLLLVHAPGPATDAWLLQHLRTATDVLRLAVAMSGPSAPPVSAKRPLRRGAPPAVPTGPDLSLATSTRFRSFSRTERRQLLGLLEQSSGGHPTEDMLRWPGRWLRLGERLHPGEFKNRFPQSYAAFDVLRNDREFHTFNGRVEQALAAGQLLAAAQLLRTRPGELARRLDHLLRLAAPDSDEAGQILAAFGEVAAQVSTPVLLQVRAHFTHRAGRAPGALRTFFPKGNVALVQAVPNTLPPLPAATCAAVAAHCERALLLRFSERPALGRVYLDPQLRNYLVPFSQRSASKALHTLVRGSRVALPAEGGDTVRFFLWWKEGDVNGQPTGRVDIDLAAVLYDANWRYLEHISWTNLRSAKYRAAHSGDITEAPHGACEFIDLDIPSVLRYGGRYVVPTLYSYTSQPYCNLPECYAGWMRRAAPQSGEIFEPATVQQRVDLAANTTIALPAILDLAARQVIWTDLALTSNPKWQNSLEGNQRGMVLMGRALTTLVKPTLYDLFWLHAAARGELVDSPASAETVFSLDAGITPFDTERIIGEYL